MNRLHRPRAKRAALALLLVALIFSVDLPAAFAQSDKPDALLAALEADFQAYLPALAQFQADYQRLHGGRYYQALDSHTIPPSDGTTETADRLQAGPTDQAEKLDLLWVVTELPAKLGYSLRIDVYDGPGGRGYTVTLTADAGGVRWTRTLNAGPEGWREQGWQVKPPDEARSAAN